MENNNTIGMLETISEKNQAVQIDGTWYSLAPQVKMSYLKKGEVEYNFVDAEDEGNPVLTFCRSTAKKEGFFPKKSPSGSYPNPLTEKGKAAVDESKENRFQSLIVAQSVFKGTGDAEGFKKFQDEVFEYLQKGMWISTEKK